MFSAISNYPGDARSFWQKAIQCYSPLVYSIYQRDCCKATYLDMRTSSFTKLQTKISSSQPSEKQKNDQGKSTRPNPTELDFRVDMTLMMSLIRFFLCVQEYQVKFWSIMQDHLAETQRKLLFFQFIKVNSKHWQRPHRSLINR